MKIKFLVTFLFLVAAASLGSANQVPIPKLPALPAQLPNADPISLIAELSPECQGAFLSIITSPEFFQCVPVAALLPVITDPTLLPGVFQDPLKNGAKLLPVIQAICAVPKCSDEGVAGAQKAIQDGCKKDQKNPLVQLAAGVLEFYSPVRDIICFEDNKDELCIVDTVANILTLPTPPFKVLGGLIDKLIGAEPKFICTPCNKAIVNTIIDFFTKDPKALVLFESLTNIGEEELKIAEIYFVMKCGFQFVDGKVPDSTIDPKKFVYQVKGDGDDSNDAGRNAAGIVMLTSILASALI